MIPTKAMLAMAGLLIASCSKSDKGSGPDTSASGEANSTGGLGTAGGATGGGGASAGSAAGGGAGAHSESGAGGAGRKTCNIDADCAERGIHCCDGSCVNLSNDVLNCGKCATACAGDFPRCDKGTCDTPDCTAGTSCAAAQQCCGTQCCTAGQLCCVVPGGPSGPPTCVAAVEGTCPVGCPSCP